MKSIPPHQSFKFLTINRGVVALDSSEIEIAQQTLLEAMNVDFCSLWSV